MSDIWDELAGDPVPQEGGGEFLKPPTGAWVLARTCSKEQGKAAPGGARSYVNDGRMTEGFALVGWPARYNETGLMTFIVNQDGVVYQKYLGPDTAAIAGAMTRFDPDASWTALPAH